MTDDLDSPVPYLPAPDARMLCGLDERHALSLDDWIGDVASCADDLEHTLSQLHEMKREVEGDTREALLVAIDKTQAAWAAAAVARTALRDVTL